MNTSPHRIRSLFFCLATALLLVAVFCLPAQAFELFGRWSGTYAYRDGRPPVNFTFEVLQPGAYFAGRITEPNTFGKGNARFLYANFQGQTHPNGTLSFIKVYDGTANVGHGVSYHGTLKNSGATIQGTWQLGNASGTFRLDRE